MKFFQALKNNLPVIMFLAVVPYFFYSHPTLSQAIIAAVLGSVAAFKYYLEAKEQPDYVKLFEEKLEERRVKFNEALALNQEKVMEEIEILRAKQNGVAIKGNIEKKINMKGWG